MAKTKVCLTLLHNQNRLSYLKNNGSATPGLI